MQDSPCRKRDVANRAASEVASLAVLSLALADVHFCRGGSRAGGLRAGAAAVGVEADDGMVIGGGIGPGRLSGQEGRLRAAAWSCRRTTRFAFIFECDTLGMTREDLDLAARDIERELKIPFDNILLTNTHTHHAPTTVTIHGYRRDGDVLPARMIEAMVAAARQAQSQPRRPVRAGFTSGREKNRRSDRTAGFCLPTARSSGSASGTMPSGPRGLSTPTCRCWLSNGPTGALQAVVFNHSTHNIGSLQPGRRSPGFYGLAAQQIEDARGGTVLFLPGRSSARRTI